MSRAREVPVQLISQGQSPCVLLPMKCSTLRLLPSTSMDPVKYLSSLLHIARSSGGAWASSCNLQFHPRPVLHAHLTYHKRDPAPGGHLLLSKELSDSPTPPVDVSCSHAPQIALPTSTKKSPVATHWRPATKDPVTHDPPEARACRPGLHRNGSLDLRKLIQRQNPSLHGLPGIQALSPGCLVSIANLPSRFKPPFPPSSTSTFYLFPGYLNSSFTTSPPLPPTLTSPPFSRHTESQRERRRAAADQRPKVDASSSRFTQTPAIPAKTSRGLPHCALVGSQSRHIRHSHDLPLMISIGFTA